MVIDVHGHLGNINFSTFWQADAKRLEEYCVQAGTDIVCLSSSRAIMYDVHEGNMELDAALKESERFLGYVVVSPTFPDSVKDLSLLQSNSKFKGVKIHPDYNGYVLATKSNRRFVEEVADKTPMMLFHVSCMPGTGFSDPLVVASIAKNHPGTKFILAHMAGTYQNGNYPYFPNLDSLEAVMDMNLDNVFIDTAHYLMYVYPGVMEKMLSICGPNHIVYGTDVPLQGPMQMRFAREVIEALPTSQENKDKILFKNAQKVLGI